ncbi:unnamed protein product [Ilex paraguariensis]|uniref:AT-rich interactive domain-containing protein 1 n=1 Tax=Ilex paraguariensis TaxID=185542 RepID=A0ABC8QUG6_9AQUA
MGLVKDKEVTMGPPIRTPQATGWSKIVDGSYLDCFKTLQKLQTSDPLLDPQKGSKGSVEDNEIDNLRCLFNQFLCVFLKEISGSNNFRPLPPLFGNGQSMDLFKLYLVVREKGGYENVSKNGLWDSVAKECGFEGIGSAVKLIYIKYLDTLDRWLQRIVKEKDSNGGLEHSGVDLDRFSLDLESAEILDQKKKDGKCLDVDLKKNELSFTGVENFGNSDGVWSSMESNDSKENNDHDQKSVDQVKDDMVLDSTVVKEDDSNRKKKRERSLGILDWVTEVAKDPCDPAIISRPESSVWNYYGNEELWKQVLLVREAMLLKRSSDSSAAQSVWQKKQKMHPAMYDDHTGSQRLRCSERLLSAKDSQALISSKKLQSRTFSESSPSGPGSESEDCFDKQSYSLVADSLWGNYHSQKRIPVGPYFQAEVPEWTGENYESDCKWLGTQIWPLEKDNQNKYLIEMDSVGKGRQDPCGCQFPGFVGCVKFHVTEERKKVNLELGIAFHCWKFDKMGEEVALSWTKEDEKKFQAIVMSNPPSMDKHFWDEMFKIFPAKSREELVSYYFNVFLLRRRGYQNRLFSSNIDSDDDESDFASSAEGFKRQAVKPLGSILCSLKKTQLNLR